MPRALELFSGTQSVSRVARTLGWETVSLDICPRHSPDLCMDIMSFDQSQYDRTHFDLIWASCPCEAYSSARTVAKIPRVEAMASSDELVAKTLQIIASKFQPPPNSLPLFLQPFLYNFSHITSPFYATVM